MKRISIGVIPANNIEIIKDLQREVNIQYPNSDILLESFPVANCYKITLPEGFFTLEGYARISGFCTGFVVALSN